MGISLEQANQMVSQTKGGGLTLAQANAKIAPKPTERWTPPPIPSAIEGTLQPLTGFLEQYQQNIKASTDLLKQGWKDISLQSSEEQVAPLVNLKGLGEGALGLISLLWSPAQTVVDQFATKPTKAIVKKVGEVLPVKESFEKPPGYDAAVRHGEKPPQWGKGVITRENVDTTVDAVNEFMSNLYSTAAGFIGGGEVVNPKMGAKAIRDLSDKDRLILGQSLTTNFDALAAKDPKAALMVADHVGRGNEEFGDKLRARITKAQDKTPAELKEIGKDTIKPRLRVVGETPEGKPRVRVMTSEQISSGMRDATKDMHDGMKPMAAVEWGPKNQYADWDHAKEVPLTSNEKIYWKSKAQTYLEQGLMDKGEYNYTMYQLDKGKLPNVVMKAHEKATAKPVKTELEQKPLEELLQDVPIHKGLGTEIEDAKALSKKQYPGHAFPYAKWPNGTPIVPFAKGEFDDVINHPLLTSQDHKIAQQNLDQHFWDGEISKSEHLKASRDLEKAMHAIEKAKPSDDEMDLDHPMNVKTEQTPPVAKAGLETHEPARVAEQPHPVEPALSTQLPPVKDGTRITLSPTGEVLNSRNLPVHATPQGQKNFLRWFGDSETVDYLGRPLVFYHGTPHDISEWNYTHPGRVRPFLSFTTDRKFAANWAHGDKVYPVYVRAKSIGDFRNPEHVKAVADFHGMSPDNYSLRMGLWTIWEDPKLWDRMGWEGTWMREGETSPSINLAIRRHKEDVKSQKANTGAFGETADPTQKVGEAPGSPQWKAFHNQVGPEIWRKLEEAHAAGVPLSVHEFLDDLGKVDSPYKDMIDHLRKHVEDVPIRPVMGEITDRTGKAWGEATKGIYDPTPHEIFLRIDDHGPARLQTALHEIVHAATSKFVHNNPFHPLVQELNRLHRISVERAKAVLQNAKVNGVELRGDLERVGPGMPYQGEYKGSGIFYGLTNILEMMAEAKTRTSFQRLLLSSEKFAKAWQSLRQVTNQMIETIGKMFGMKLRDAPLLGNILQTTDKIIEAQARFRQEAREGPLASEEDPWEITPRPKFNVAVGKLEEYANQAIRTFNPEALGPEAKTAGATIAKHISKQIQADSMRGHQSAARRSWWIKNADMARGFIAKAERGERLKNPWLEKARRIYARENKEIALQDKAAGFQYDEREHYMAHIFEDGKKAVDAIRAKYGKKFGDPAFIKERMWEMYEDALKAGAIPKYTNPEDIMQARWHASNIAKMRVDSLREMEGFGVAKKMTKEDHAAPEYPATQWRSPNGDWYWVHNDAHAVMHNAFDTKSLWEMKGFGGDAFRVVMGLKNRIVPIKLALSLFHPLHIATIDNATQMVRASKELMSGTMSPGRWSLEMLRAADPVTTLYRGLYSNPKQGSRLLRLWQGRLKDITDADRQALTYMFEGGLIPEMSSQYRTNSKRLLKDAVDRHSAVAVFHAPFAAVEATQGIMFDLWIPSLKIASYLKDVETALKTDPSLIDDADRRQQAFRRLSKSVDNRYGEMAYSTLFWNRMVKDIAVANTLSLSWNLGFLREYGGGAMDIGQFMREGAKAQRIKEGRLDKPMFLLYYSTYAMAFTGLMGWALSGNRPQELIDYFYPQTGGVDKDGKPNRATTMFYPREFYAIAKHIQAKGIVAGLSEAILNKTAPIIGMVRDAYTGLNAMGDQIRNPNSPLYKQVEQTLASLWQEGKPITLTAAEKGPGDAKHNILAGAGFGPAPKYATDTAIEGRIKALYDKTYAKRETPYMQAEKSKEAQVAKQAYMSNDPKYDQLMDAMKQQFDPKELDPKFESKLTKAWEREAAKDEKVPPTAKLFQRMYWEDQQALLDQMTPEEREVYLPYSNKTYLRDNYEPPEVRKKHEH
jgi:ADP-Ribosyltransferase in polyvalent proteins